MEQSSDDWFRFRNASSDRVELDIYGTIGGFSWFDDEENVNAKSFRRELKNHKGKDLTVHINSPGGSVFEGLAIYNALKQHDGEVEVIVDALAASAASFIAMAASPGQLQVARNGVMMIHDAAGLAIGNAADMREMADLLDMHSDNIADIYAQRSGEDAAFWRTAMVEETWYTGLEAVEAGLADAVLSTEDEDEDAEKAANKFDLSIFNYAGRDQAPAPSVIHKRIKAQMAQAKESTVGKTPTAPKVKNEGGENPPADEEQQTQQQGGENSPAEGEQQTEQQGGENPPAGTEETGEAGADGNGEPVPGTQPTNSGVVPVVVNGATFQVPGPVAQQMNVLQTFFNETREQGRKDFVASLAATGKIAAPQITATETFALGLSDDQYQAWTQTWDTAPSNPLFAQHGEGTSNHNGDGSTPTSEREREIETLEAIIAHHRNGGRTQAQIENMESWKRLQQLKSTTTS